jgi:putative nucleotide binding protein
MVMPFLRDENVIVLDFLPRGHATGRQEPLAQVIGNKYFSLLEVVVRKDVTLKPGEVVYIGESKRDHIDHIKRRITIKDLTTFAKSELPFIVEKLVKENEEKFVNFFNTCRPISTRLHQLELLPGVGKKHMWDIIKERKKGEFKSFKDISQRIKLMPDPANIIIKRVMEELEDDNIRYRLFVAGPVRRF